MYRLPFIILLIFGFIPILAQNPHGDELKIDCAQCHNPNEWALDMETILFDHNDTSFDLDGTHTQIDCKECHTDLKFNDAPTDCISCHLDVHSQSVGNDCMRCHTTDNWLVFNTPELHEQNGFPLIGTHNNLSCVECHINESTLIFNPIGNECIQCHRDDYLTSQNPNHVEAGFSTDCLECHDPLGFGWDSEDVIHDFFPLTLGHDIANCNECHVNGNFSNTPTDCYACHEQDYIQTTNPDHELANLPIDCIQCHTTNPGWIPATMDHEFFPLTLGHDVQDCNECHINSNYNNTPTDCFACHEDDYNQSTDPDHEAANLPIDCVICHTTNPGWMPATIDHEFFPLTLGHDIQDCNECHINGNYNNTPTDCFACHEDDYNQTTNPDHEAANLPTDCILCHTTNPGWMPATINHEFFPLTLGHDIQDCNECHINGNYNNTPTDCFACHEDDYNQTTNPDHEAANIPTDCILCHTTNPGWMPATINHEFFPLTLGHDIQDCNECHINGNYNDTPTDCFACHEDDYNQTTDPNHQAANFPTDCVICHTTNPGWMPATFDHDFFPIYSGPHDAEWNDCLDCHINPNDYTMFTCITCHTEADTNDQHSDVQDYVYESNACLQCHPDGTADF